MGIDLYMTAPQAGLKSKAPHHSGAVKRGARIVTVVQVDVCKTDYAARFERILATDAEPISFVEGGIGKLPNITPREFSVTPAAGLMGCDMPCKG